MWDPQAKPFAREFRVIRYDVRGFGRSSPAKAPYSDADDLTRLLEHLDVDRPMLVGVSNGGRIALDFAVSHPDSVEALVPVCSGLHGYDPRENPEAAAAFAALDRAERELSRLYRTGKIGEAVEGVLALWCATQGPRTRPLVQRMVTENAAAAFSEGEFSIPAAPSTAGRLGAIRAPTLVVTGERDVPAIHFIADHLDRAIPGATRTEIAGGDHLPNLSRTEPFNQVVLDFLR